MGPHRRRHGRAFSGAGRGRVLALAAWLVLAFTGLGCSEPGPPQSAVLILLDTLRADRLSAYGYPESTSPNIDALAEDGVLFETVVSSGAWTLPGMAGIFAGDFPNRGIYNERLLQSIVPELQEAGFQTAAFAEGGFLSASFGFDRGFDEFHNGSRGEFGAGEEHDPQRTMKTFAAAKEWLQEHADQPFFLVVHTYEPHTPYNRLRFAGSLDSGALPRRFSPMEAARVKTGKLPFGETERRYVRALYDGGVFVADREVGGLMETLEDLGVRDHTIVVVTSDHGDDIGGRAPEWPGVHGQHLYDEMLLVPLVVHDPTRRFPVTRVTHQVRTIDVMHTILDLLGFAPLPSIHGRSLVPLMTEDEFSGRFAWSRSTFIRFFEFPDRSSLRAGGHKLITTRRPDGSLRTELYDLASDPGERVDLSETDLRRTRQMSRQLARIQAGIEQPQPARYTIRPPVEEGEAEDIEAQLRALGYVE